MRQPFRRVTSRKPKVDVVVSVTVNGVPTKPNESAPVEVKAKEPDPVQAVVKEPEPDPVLKVERLPKLGKKAFLILGPESTGTRLHARMLKANGVFGGDGHYQKLDVMDRGLLEGHETVFLRRSFPHGGKKVSISPQVIALFEGYPITAIVTMRAWKYILGSSNQIKTDKRVGEEYRRIFEFIFEHNLAYVMSSMEALIAHPGAQQAWLFHTLGLPLQKVIDIRDCNSKYE